MDQPASQGLGERLVSLSLRNPHLIMVACLVIIILGALSLVRLPKDLLPLANLPAVQVLTFYNGMPVKDIEENLTYPLERFTGQAIGLKRQESKSLVGVSIIRNYFGSNVSLDTAISQVTSLVMSDLKSLPPGTLPPYILPFDPTASVPLALVAINGGPDKTIEQVYDLARYRVRNTIQSVPGAIAPTVMGGTVRQIIIYLDPLKLLEYNYSPLAVLQKFSQLNTFIPSGDIKIGDFDYQIISNGLVDNIDEMNNFPLRAMNGVTVTVKDIGHVADSGQIQTNVVLIDGQQEVYVPVYRAPGGNSIEVVEQVRTAMQELSQHLPEVTLSVVADQTVFIRHAINSIAEEGLLGGGLAALMIFLFLGNPRATFGIVLSLPLALLIAFIGLNGASQTVNAMTLGGLALSIGVLVDNSIVVLENISKKLEHGLAPLQAAMAGAAEVAMPVMSSTLATLIVLFPVVFLTGIVKVLFAALAKAVMFAMIGSFFIAMTVMPLFAAHQLKQISIHERAWFFRIMHHFMQSLTAKYAKLLTIALNHRKTVLSGALILLLTGAVLTPLIGTELFPVADSGDFVITMRLASGTRIENTTAFAETIDQKLRQWIPAHDLKMVITNAGIFYGYPAAYTPNVGTQDVFFHVIMTADRIHTSQYYAKIIRQKMAQEYPHVEVAIQLGGLLSSAISEGLRAPIDVQIQGSDLKQAYNIATQLAAKIKQLSGAVDVHVQERFDEPIINVDIHRDAAMQLGITAVNVIKNLVSAVVGSAAFDSNNIWVDPKSGIQYYMSVQFPPKKIASFEELNNIPVRAEGRNRTVPLSQLATISQTTGPTQINHVNYRPVIDLYLAAQGRDIGGLSNAVQKIINATAIPKGYRVDIRGEIAEMKSSIGSLGGGFLLAAALVYLVLVVQFRSFMLPLIIMAAVPLGLVGIVIMLVATKTYFSIQAAIGAIFMIGIAVANGVLLIEFIIHHTRQQDDFIAGIVAGAQARLRPILMTSLAAVFALIPMAIGMGHGSETNIPLGRAVIGGQLCSMVLTLFVVPVLYSLLAQKPKPLAERMTS